MIFHRVKFHRSWCRLAIANSERLLRTAIKMNKSLYSYNNTFYMKENFSFAIFMWSFNWFRGMWSSKTETRQHPMFYTIRLYEVYKKTGAELNYNGIVGRNLETKQKVPCRVFFVPTCWPFFTLQCLRSPACNAQNTISGRYKTHNYITTSVLWLNSAWLTITSMILTGLSSHYL